MVILVIFIRLNHLVIKALLPILISQLIKNSVLLFVHLRIFGKPSNMAVLFVSHLPVIFWKLNSILLCSTFHESLQKWLEKSFCRFFDTQWLYRLMGYISFCLEMTEF